MGHYTPLMTTIVAGIGLAFVLGAVANRLRISPLVGYLLAGVAVGPHTPGFIADQNLAAQLAEIGVILLMFGVGLNFSFKELLSVRAIAAPGAIAQMCAATLAGMGLAWAMGWNLGAGFVFGLSLSVASTVVATRGLQERHLLETERGRIAIGWLIVEDLAMVLVLVLLPTVAALENGAGADAAAGAPMLWDVLAALAVTLGKVVAFVLVMLLVGRRVIPWVLHTMAHTGSRELFRLAVLAIALTVAFGASEIFGISFALGAFFAGMVMSESQLSQQAAAETLPLRDAFAVLFFVSVGMLFDPLVAVNQPWALLATFLTIIAVPLTVAPLIMRLFHRPVIAGLTVGASLAQIGEFSFILAGLGVGLGLMPEEGRDLVLAGAMLSVLLNPALFAAIERAKPWLERHEIKDAAAPAAVAEEPELLAVTSLSGHAIIVGFGRVGSRVAEALRRDGQPLLVIEEKLQLLEHARQQGFEGIFGNATLDEVLRAANVAGAAWMFVAIPDAFEAGQIIQQARALSPAVKIIARAHSDAEVSHLNTFGPDEIVMGEDQIARAMIEYEVAHRAGAQTGTAAEPAPAAAASTS